MVTGSSDGTIYFTIFNAILLTSYTEFSILFSYLRICNYSSYFFSINILVNFGTSNRLVRKVALYRGITAEITPPQRSLSAAARQTGL